MKFTRGNNTIVFYKKDDDEKYSFLIKDNPELTEQILYSVKKKRIKKNKIKYAVDGIFDLINSNKFKEKPEMKTETNPIVKLAEIVQKQYGANIETQVIGKKGPEHCPEIEVEIIFPDGKFYVGKANNKKVAKQKAAQLALKELGYE